MRMLEAFLTMTAVITMNYLTASPYYFSLPSLLPSLSVRFSVFASRDKLTHMFLGTLSNTGHVYVILLHMHVCVLLSTADRLALHRGYYK